MDGTVRDVQHLIMLRVLSAQSADEPAPLAPGDRHRFHVATHPRFRRLAPEEPPPLAVRPLSSLSAILHRPRAFAQRGKALRMGPSELREPETGREGHRTLEVSGVAVLDQLFELSLESRWHRHRFRSGFARRSHEGAHRVGAGREPVVPPKAVEKRLFLGGEAYSEKSSRGGVGSGVPHAFNRNLTYIYTLLFPV